MPRVRMLTSVAGRNFDWAIGEEVDMTPQEAQIWADGVRGELVTEPRVDTPERRRAARETRSRRRR